MSIYIIQPKDNKSNDQAFIIKQEVHKESTQRIKEEIEQKEFTSVPHPYDKHSGTGRGKEMRKNGIGKNNWGNYQDDLKHYGDEDIEDVEDQPEIIEQENTQVHDIPKKPITQKEEPFNIDEENFPKIAK